MTVATISKPSQPITCHPDYNPCEPPNSECQFSFSSFKYICCQDRDDMKPPGKRAVMIRFLPYLCRMSKILQHIENIMWWDK